MDTNTNPASGASLTQNDGLFSKAVCLLVERRCLGVTRKVGGVNIVPTVTDEVPSDSDEARAKVKLNQDWCGANKRILDSKNLKDIRTCLNDVTAQLRKRCTPSVMFQGGVYLMPMALLDEVDDYLVTKRRELDRLVAKFASFYEDDKSKARENLQELFNARDYPPVEEVVKLFGLSWQYIVVDTPRRLEEVRADIYQREQEKAAEKWTDAMAECTAVLRASFSDLVSHMVERLTPDLNNGKKRVFRDSMVKNVRDFLSNFEARNLGNDEQLSLLVSQANSILSGVDASVLRDSDMVREKVRLDFAEMKQRLDALVVEAPTRKYGAVIE